MYSIYASCNYHDVMWSYPLGLYIIMLTLLKNDQDGAKLNSDLKPEVPYKSMGNSCNNSPLKLKAGHHTCHTFLLHERKCMLKRDCLPSAWVSYSLSSPYFCMGILKSLLGFVPSTLQIIKVRILSIGNLLNI